MGAQSPGITDLVELSGLGDGAKKTLGRFQYVEHPKKQFPRFQTQSREIMDLVALIGLGDGNKKPLGKLKNDVRRSLRKTFSSKTRDVLQHVETRMNVRRFCSTLSL